MDPEPVIVECGLCRQPFAFAPDTIDPTRAISAISALPQHPMLGPTVLELCDQHRAELMEASAANLLSNSTTGTVASIIADLGSERVLDWEMRACRQPGALDSGTHIIVAARKPPPPNPRSGAAREPEASDPGSPVDHR